jgi:Fur family ferric uptake transcriptional regulator|tara:strand:+ start:1120 stop:1545 length:426 start_codon:yes stop_codon:yes gene_type:complete
MEKTVTEILLEKNLSITSPRKLIIEEIIKNSNPISIESLQKRLEGKVALSTLYRALNDLKSAEIIKEFTTTDSITMFELISLGEEHHHHLFCTSCGKIIDIDLSKKFEKNVDAEVVKIEKNFNYKITEHTLELLGLCSKCK